MATLLIPTSQTLPRYRERITLDGEPYIFTFRWNTRAAAWFLDVADGDGVMLVAGRRCVIDNSMLVQFGHIPGIPPGIVTVYDTSRRSAPPQLEDFGTRCLCLYHDAAGTERIKTGEPYQP